ncbi:MAG: amidohydrolase family protein, partial [Planctomycetota bacterium]
LRTAWALHSGVSARQILSMGTEHAAFAVAADQTVGSLAPGKRADLVALPIDPSVADPEQEILENDSSPCGVWLGGRRVI